MNPRTHLAAFAPGLTAWRRDLHAHPELGFAEHRTSEFVASKLAGFGVDRIVRGIGGTGLVATIRSGSSERAIGLRADMDALPMQEAPGLPYASTIPGQMHACGHDGHTTMLLGAAQFLAAHRRFDGTVHLIFQPAEESLGLPVPGSSERNAGALAMMRDGLFERFPMQAIFGMHNRPGLPLGSFGIRPGVIYAATDRFEITVHGKGGHAARPHLGVDPLVVAASMLLSLQTIASRSFNPLEPVVVSVCQIEGGSAFNILPDTVRMVGTVRAVSNDGRMRAERLVRQIVQGTAATFGAGADLDYQVGFPALINDAGLAATARAAMVALVGEEHVVDLSEPTMGGEDFACYLARKPGCFVLIGNGTEGRCGNSVHNAAYDFNDDALPLGAAFWAQLVEILLPVDDLKPPPVPPG